MRNLSIDKLNRKVFEGEMVSGRQGCALFVQRKLLYVYVRSQCLFFEIKSSVT